MATTFYLRNKEIGVATYGNGTNGFIMTLDRGDTAVTETATTTSGGTWIQICYFTTSPLVAFTLSGTITCNLRGAESNGLANASLGARFYKWTTAAGLGAQIVQASATVELGTTESAVTATATAPSTSFANGDVLVVEIGVINIGTMGNARTVTLYNNGSTAGGSGDSYITITQNVVFANRASVIE